MDAHLDADGALRVTERQSMVFTGDWNGGERTFDIRPRQKLSFIGISRLADAGWLELTERPGLYAVDDYAWAAAHTVRWRSRLPQDPRFRSQPIRYCCATSCRASC